MKDYLDFKDKDDDGEKWPVLDPHIWIYVIIILAIVMYILSSLFTTKLS